MSWLFAPYYTSRGDAGLSLRNITLQTKVHVVKAMAFPEVMYGCKSWTVKNAELQRIDAFKLLEKTLDSL